MVLIPKPLPRIRKAMPSKTMFSRMYEMATGKPVANWMMVQRPVRPPLAIPFGIRKLSQAMQKIRPPRVIRT